jgi:hypothetical protein
VFCDRTYPTPSEPPPIGCAAIGCDLVGGFFDQFLEDEPAAIFDDPAVTARHAVRQNWAMLPAVS